MKNYATIELITELKDIFDYLSGGNQEASNHPLVVKASETDNDDILRITAEVLLGSLSAIRQAVIEIEKLAEQSASKLDEKDLEEMAILAEEFDKSGDPLLMKQASVLDQILLTIAAPKGAQDAFKLAEEKEINRLREKYRGQSIEDCYKKPKQVLDEHLKVADVEKAVKEGIKDFRPLESSLSTRTCPDHPGAQMSRVADYTFQCSLDKKVYNYQTGYSTMKGNKVPGGDVSIQSQSLVDRPVEHMSFDTRESKLNNS